MLSPASPFVTLIHMHICTWWCISSDNYFASIDSISLDAVVCWGTSKPRLLPTLISHVHMFWLVASPSIYCISGWSCYIVLTGFREYTDLSGEQNIPPPSPSLSQRERERGGERARMRVCVCVWFLVSWGSFVWGNSLVVSVPLEKQAAPNTLLVHKCSIFTVVTTGYRTKQDGDTITSVPLNLCHCVVSHLHLYSLVHVQCADAWTLPWLAVADWV